LLVACPWSSTNSGIQVLAKPRLGGAKLTKLSSALALGLKRVKSAYGLTGEVYYRKICY
jgi:hypothetical protein